MIQLYDHFRGCSLLVIALSWLEIWSFLPTLSMSGIRIYCRAVVLYCFRFSKVYLIKLDFLKVRVKDAVDLKKSPIFFSLFFFFYQIVLFINKQSSESLYQWCWMNGQATYWRLREQDVF